MTLIKKNLKKPENLTQIFNEIRNHLAGSIKGITRDEIIAKQIINILFCKIQDELETNQEDFLSFYAKKDDTEEAVKVRINNLFTRVKTRYNTIFSKMDEISLAGKDLKYVVEKLQDYSLLNAERDAIRKAFEVFIGPALRGSEGQFFTPRNVINTCIKIIDPKLGEKIIDPACGSAGFLVNVLIYLLNKIKNENGNSKESLKVANESLEKSLINYLYGMDKDEFLSKVSKAYMSLVGKGKENIFCENSLDLPQNWSKETLDKIKLNEFDILFTNPPFGSKIKIKEKKILEQYELGHRWTKTNKGMEKTSILLKSQTPQILFIERCLQLLKDGGRMAIVLPEGLLGNPSHEYIRSFIMKNSKILAVIDAPKETFLPNTQTKTCILFLQKGKTHKNDYEIFMAIAEKCGHDSRDNIIYKIDKKGNLLYDNLGNKIIDDDFPEICKNYSRFIQDEPLIYNRKGFKVKISELKSLSLIPRFYDPFINEELKKLSKNYDLVRIKDLIKKGIISIRKGQGIEKKYYGTGDIPYVRTSDIVNWELKIDPSKSVSNEIYEKFKQDLKINDILIVIDGGHLIGNTCMLIEERDTRCLIQGHIDIIRCEVYEKLNPFLLMYFLNTKIVRDQIKANIVIQSTLATIGERILDVFIPIPKSPERRKNIIEKTKTLLIKRTELRNEIEKINYNKLEEY